MVTEKPINITTIMNRNVLIGLPCVQGAEVRHVIAKATIARRQLRQMHQ